MAKPTDPAEIIVRQRAVRRLGLGMCGVGLLVAAAGAPGASAVATFVPGSSIRIVFWLLAAVLVWAGLTLWRQNRTPGPSRFRFGSRQPHPVRPTHATGKPVRLTQVPNVPIAEMLCARLRENGIEAFYKGASPLGGPGSGVASLGPTFPADIWVGEADVEQACRFLPK